LKRRVWRKLANSLFAIPLLAGAALLLWANEQQRITHLGSRPAWFDGAGLILLLVAFCYLVWVWRSDL
jgi:uncharacterized membrane protein